MEYVVFFPRDGSPFRAAGANCDPAGYHDSRRKKAISGPEDHVAKLDPDSLRGRFSEYLFGDLVVVVSVRVESLKSGCVIWGNVAVFFPLFP
jgi:hypothetical protein